MRVSKLIPRTRHQVAEGLSGAHALLVRAGYIRQVDRGLFVLCPLGFRVWRKLQDIIFEEMERDGVLNINMPILQPRELWEKTGRWDLWYDRSLTMLQTMNEHTGLKYGLAPTAEEVVTWLAAMEIQSYQDLPVTFHQIGWKVRNEVRPHGGLIRGIEFDMSDAYSFDRDEQGMHRSFELFRALYTRIFLRVGLRRFIVVQADSGAIGGKGSAEFMAVSDMGEDTLITCQECVYGANVERAVSRYPRPEYPQEMKTRQRVHAPGMTSVPKLETQFAKDGVTAERIIKTMILTATHGRETYQVAVCIRGDLEINLVKVRNALGVKDVTPTKADLVLQTTGAEIGFAGPLSLMGRGTVRQILFDQSVKGMTNFLCGMGETDYYSLNVNFDSSLPLPKVWYELHQAKSGHLCICCGGVLNESHGIEVGHIFMLQTEYAKKMGAKFRNADGHLENLWMGCYGIGVTRLLQTIVEQSHDDQGIIWPESITPYRVHIIPINWQDIQQRKVAEDIYRHLCEVGVETILDDRDLHGGEKLIDADLLGMSWQVIVGRDTKNGLIELRNRADGTVVKVTVKELIAHFTNTNQNYPY